MLYFRVSDQLSTVQLQKKLKMKQDCSTKSAKFVKAEQIWILIWLLLYGSLATKCVMRHSRCSTKVSQQCKQACLVKNYIAWAFFCIQIFNNQILNSSSPIHFRLLMLSIISWEHEHLMVQFFYNIALWFPLFQIQTSCRNQWRSGC